MCDAKARAPLVDLGVTRIMIWADGQPRCLTPFLLLEMPANHIFATHGGFKITSCPFLCLQVFWR